MKVIAWPETTITDTVTPPTTEFVFTGGLLLNYNGSIGDRLYLAQTCSTGTPNQGGDGIAWVIEGSSYTQPA